MRFTLIETIALIAATAETAFLAWNVRELITKARDRSDDERRWIRGYLSHRCEPASDTGAASASQNADQGGSEPAV